MTIFQSYIDTSKKIEWGIFLLILCGIYIPLAFSGDVVIFCIVFAISFGFFSLFYAINVSSFIRIDLNDDELIVLLPFARSESFNISLETIKNILFKVKMSRGHTFYCLHIIWIDENNQEFDKEFTLGFTTSTQIQFLIDQLRHIGLDVPVLNETYGENIEVE